LAESEPTLLVVSPILQRRKIPHCGKQNVRIYQFFEFNGIVICYGTSSMLIKQDPENSARAGGLHAEAV
jgi:hypothetical protein